jgi:signal transduction histidine kinase
LASLRIQLIVFWLLLLGVCAGLGAVMLVLYQNSAGVQIGQARALTQHVCESIAERYRQSRVKASEEPQTALLQVVLQLGLVEAPHVEGGVWDMPNGFLAYAYPTYEGGGAKRDVPEAERSHIAEVARSAALAQSPQTDILRGTREALVLTACPLPTLTSGQNAAVWTMTRVPAEAEAALGNLRVGLVVLLGAVLSSGLWLGGILTRGYRHVQNLEAALGTEDAQSETVPRLNATGVEELDRIVSAVNRYSARLHAAQGQARALLRQQAHDQRLTALGRMTGGIAHEIRNPIATMRLQAENALVATPQGQTETLQNILQQIDRLDRLVQNLLATVQPLQLQVSAVPIAAWLDERRLQVKSRADMRNIGLTFNTAVDVARFDPLHVGRAVDNLLDNAVRHARAVGHVELHILRAASGALVLRVTDNGPGVPVELRDHLFEPFATSRAEGTGLGLALVREIALAHDGDVRYRPQDTGACFELELPWRES